MNPAEPENTQPKPEDAQAEKVQPVAKPRVKITHLLLTGILILSIGINLYLAYGTQAKLIGAITANSNSPATSFSLLDPEISVMDINSYLDAKDKYVASYVPLKEDVNQIISKANGTFGVYFEDLQFHSWFGINERESFRPASMLKITTVAAILAEVHDGDLSLDTEVTLDEDDLNYKFGNLYEQINQTFTIRKLIEISLISSDNTAIKKLHEYMDEEHWAEARLSMGLPETSVAESEAGTALTPKEFSCVFRSLYYSGYLCRTFSNWILMMLSETEFNQGIPAGVPKGVVVSHKIGEWAEEGSMHDCGIVYAKKPYILCIMSSDTSVDEGNKVIKDISKTVYDFVSKS